MIKIAALPTLPKGTNKPTTGYPGKSFRLGVIGDATTWQAFLAKAQVTPFANQDYKPDFATDVIVFAVLDAQTNGLGFKSWSIDASGNATLTVSWSGIEPFYTDATPAVLVGVPRASLKAISLVSQHGPIVSHSIPQP